MCGSAGGAVAIGPAHASVGAQLEAAVACGRFENVTAQILQRLLAGADRLDMDHPALLPDFARKAAQFLGMVFLERLIKEMTEVVAQGIDRQEELFFGWHPLALIRAEAAAGDQVMKVRVINESPAPGVEDAEHRRDPPAFFCGRKPRGSLPDCGQEGRS